MSDESNKANPVKPSTKDTSERAMIETEERRARDRVLAKREEEKDQSTRYFGG